MNLKEVRQWIVTIIICLPGLPTVNLQMAMQTINMSPHMFAFPPPPPMPAPMPFPAPAPIAFQILEIQETKTTTTTTEKSNGKEERTFGIAIPVGYPSPVQFAVPAYAAPAICKKKPRPKNCPEPAHLSHDAPDPVFGPAFPMPIPMPMMASQGLMFPMHQKINRKTNSRTRRNYDDSDETSEDASSYSTEWVPRKRRRRKNTRRIGRRAMYKKRFDFDMNDDNDFAKPVLSYLTNDGYVKLEKPLSRDEAAELMDEDKFNQNVQVVTDNDEEKGQRLKVITNLEKSNNRRDSGGKRRKEPSSPHRNRQVSIRSGAQHVLGDGRKEIVFKPPIDKKISNLSVSFQIT